MAKKTTRGTTHPSTKKAPIVMCSLTIEGFKSHFDSKKLDICPLTVLAGANSSGKSSAMHALLLVKQTIDAMPLDAGGLKLDNPNVHFTNAEQFLSHEPGKAPRKDFSLTFGYSNGTSVGIKFRRTTHAVDVVSTTYIRGETTVELHEGVKIPPEFGSMFPEQASFYKVFRVADAPPVRWASFLVPGIGRVKGLIELPPFVPPPIRSTTLVLESLIHIPGSRGNPLRSFPRTVAGNANPGVFTDVAPAILADWTIKKAPELEKLNQALRDLELTWKAEGHVVDAASIEVKVARTARPFQGSAQDLVNIADVGFGVSQALPIVVALIAAKSGQLVYVEQPEIHLHPRAIMALADLIADAARRGVRCIIETHSDVMLRRLQWNVARRGHSLKHTDVIFHWFSRDDRGHTQVNSVRPDESGAYGNWPVDFAEVDAKNAREYIAAAEAHLPDEE